MPHLVTSAEHCEHCGIEADESGELCNGYCDVCYDQYHFCCEGNSRDCVEVGHIDDMHTTPSGEPLCESCFDERIMQCADCNCDIDLEDVYHTTNNYEDIICESCGDNYITCEGYGCDCRVHVDDALTDDDGSYYCESCYADIESEADEFPALRFQPQHVTYDRIKSRRQYGIELETSKCPDHKELRDEVHFNSKYDGSIQGMEFTSVPLRGDQGLDAVDEFCKMAKDRQFETNSTCGYHLHIDVSDVSGEGLRAIALAYYLSEEIWQSFVPKSRRRNIYCEPMLDTVPDTCQTERFANLIAQQGTRYRWLNLAAYNRFETFEIRLHTQTLNAEKINNWVKAHSRFIDCFASMTVDEVIDLFSTYHEAEGLALLSDVWGDSDLTEFYTKRQEKFSDANDNFSLRHIETRRPVPQCN